MVVKNAHALAGHTGITRHSPRNGCNGYFVDLPGAPGVLATVACAPFRRLDTSVGVSGPHDFARPRKIAVRYRRIRVHRIPPRGRDDRDSPLFRDGTQ